MDRQGPEILLVIHPNQKRHVGSSSLDKTYQLHAACFLTLPFLLAAHFNTKALTWEIFSPNLLATIQLTLN